MIHPNPRFAIYIKDKLLLVIDFLLFVDKTQIVNLEWKVRRFYHNTKKKKNFNMNKFYIFLCVTIQRNVIIY